MNQPANLLDTDLPENDPDDRDDAVTYCALATGKGRDHMFEYRARTADGRLVWLRDFVMVIRSADSVSLRLRGAMFDVSREKVGADSPPAPAHASASALRALPSRSRPTRCATVRWRPR